MDGRTGGQFVLAGGLTMADQQRDYFLGALASAFLTWQISTGASIHVWAYRKAAWATEDAPLEPLTTRSNGDIV